MNTVLLPSVASNQKIDVLYQKFLTLKPYEQSVLRLLAIVHKPLLDKKLKLFTDTLVVTERLPGKLKDYTLTVKRKNELAKEDLLVLDARSKTVQLNPLLCNRLMHDIEQLPLTQQGTGPEKLQLVLDVLEEIEPNHKPGQWRTLRQDAARQYRNAYFLGMPDKIEAALNFNKNPQMVDHHANSFLVELLFMPFDLGHFYKLSMQMQYQAFATLFRECQQQGHGCEYATSLLEQVCAKCNIPDNQLFNANCHHLLAEQYLYQGRLWDFKRTWVLGDQSSYGFQLAGIYKFLKGDIESAIEMFERAIKAKNKLGRRKRQFIDGLPGYFYKLALMVSGNRNNSNHLNIALDQIEFEQQSPDISWGYSSFLSSMARAIRSIASGSDYNDVLTYSCIKEDDDAFYHQLFHFNYLLSHVWCNETQDKKLAATAKRYSDKFKQLGYPLFAQVCLQIQAHILKRPFKDEHEFINLCPLIAPKPEWELALDKLIALGPDSDVDSKSDKKNEKPVRLIWVFEENNYFRLQAREQRLSKSGWSKGKVISLKRMKEETVRFDFLSSSDHKICDAIESYKSWGYRPKTEYSLRGINALRAAIGIDNLYCEDDFSKPVELLEKPPELMVTQLADELCLTVPHYSDAWEDEDSNEEFSLTRLSDSQLQATFYTHEHVKVCDIVGDSGLLIPTSAKQKVLAGIAAVAPLLNIQSDVAQLDTGLETSDCDPNLMINIQPFKEGLSFTCVVMPFGEEGPSFIPGIGNTSITADIQGKRLATQRDLQREEKLLDTLDDACQAFLAMSDNVLIKDDLANALEVLEQLETVAENGEIDLVLRWPKGKKLKLSKTLKSEDLLLSIGKNKEWFDITGELQIDSEEVLELRKLLALMTTTSGRFIELDAQQILVLSQELRQKLDQINNVADEGKFHPLASLQMEEATSGMRMKTLHAWEAQTKKMHQANKIEPVVPSTFQGQLRDYQLLGFDWASRLAHWGAGACLADDMGLGKTLQALAVLLYRAANGSGSETGPALVIAPTSVCFNWQQEALKFAPTLNMHLFADASGTKQRQQLLESVSSFDCVIISYGLLQRETELLKKVHWHTIIADEAQALKNPLAKRTKAAYALKGDFKMITTGTPIENDLTELWSLFRFINPGLLGNLKRFSDRFAVPMENAEEDRIAAHKASMKLKTLIQPFVLRRMKNQVLTELPSRTEITVKVQMSEKEQSFYEALRLNAIDNISNVDSQSHKGEQRIKMLAELVKLRQACCNPQLVTPDLKIPSAKLAALDELLDELRLNNHKALIFSQFVGHLQLIKQHVEAKGFSYQYLDGSTPQKVRQTRVNAFQSGNGDLFLISLKAGGSGLNLTAADYVIHMDPWWNPAVEEQASDRAHRLGQKRPVTIYRLVAQNTIEEKIVALHQHKRDIADKVLSGNEVATKLSVDDVLVLLKDTF